MLCIKAMLQTRSLRSFANKIRNSCSVHPRLPVQALHGLSTSRIELTQSLSNNNLWLWFGFLNTRPRIQASLMHVLVLKKPQHFVLRLCGLAKNRTWI